jgi:hypothetical protein
MRNIEIEPYEFLHDRLLIDWPMIAEVFGISVQSMRDRFERELRAEIIVFDSCVGSSKGKPIALQSRLRSWVMEKAQRGEIL